MKNDLLIAIKENLQFAYPDKPDEWFNWKENDGFTLERARGFLLRIRPFEHQADQTEIDHQVLPCGQAGASPITPEQAAFERYFRWQKDTPRIFESLNEEARALWKEVAQAAIDADPVRKWIRAEDRLPEESNYYLVFRGLIEDEEICDQEVAEWSCDMNQWSGLCDPDEVTHWMPLPGPPSALASAEPKKEME